MADATSTQLQELYVAYFGRAADPDGLEYWTAEGISQAKFAADMYAADEFKGIYGSLSIASQVNQIYKNLFDREADPSGLLYWTKEINTGNLQLAEIATHLIYNVQQTGGDADDLAALTNKTNAAVAYTAKVKESTAAILAYQAKSVSPWEAGVNFTEAVSFLSAINKTTSHTDAGVAASVTTISNNGLPSTYTAPVAPVVPVVVVPENTTTALTTSVDNLTGGAGDDLFKSTNATLQASDLIDGGAGTDTIEFVDSSNSGTAMPGVALTNVENVVVRNLSGSAATAAATEVTDVTFKDIPGYETLAVAGLTFTAGFNGATAAQLSKAFTVGAADATNAGDAIGAVMTGTITSGFTAAQGGNTTTTTFTAGSTGAVTDLAATGTATTATDNITVLALAIAPGNVDNALKVTVNDVIISSGLATSADAAGLSVIANSLAANINAHVGDQVAFWDGESKLVLTKGTTATNFTTVGTSNTTTGTFSAAPTVSSYVIAIDPATTTADSTAAYVNGQVIGTAAYTGNSLDSAGAALVTAINNRVGRTVATYTTGTNTIAVDGGGEPVLVSNVAIGTGPLGDTPTMTTLIKGSSAAAAPTFNVTTQGAAAVSAFNTNNTQTVDTSNFVGVNSYKNYASSAAVKFTGIASNNTVVVEAVTAGTGATTDAQFAAAVVKGDSTVGTLELKSNTSAGTITVGNSAGTGFETLNITATGKNTIGGSGIVSKGAKTVTLSADAATDVIISSDVASKGTLTVTGAGKVTLNTLDTAFDTVDASGNSGGIVVTDIGDTGTVYTLSSGDDKFTTAADGFATANKFAVAAGDGTDELVLAASADLNATTEGSRYTGFEKLTTGDWNQDSSLVAGITALEITGATTNRTISKISAAAASDVTLDTTNVTALTLSLKNTTGSSDTVTIDLKSDTSTTNVDLVAVKVAGVETLNVKGSTGTAGTDSDITLGASGADKLTAVNLSGTADMTFAATQSAKAITLTSTSTGAITITGAFIKGSTVTTLAGKDEITLGSNLGVTYDSGAGNDTFTTAEFSYLVATGTDDHVIKAGAGIDTLDIDTATPIIIDNHFTNVTGLEKLTFAATGDYSITTGAAFKTAFADSVEITSGALDDESSFVYAGGLYHKDTKITIDGSGLVANATGENITVTTGNGNDTVKTGTDASWLGVSGANGSAMTVSTGAGDDTIEFGTGILAGQTITAAVTITGGKGVDKITRTGALVNSAADTTGVVTYVFADGDSVVGAYDTITGYVNAESTSSLHGDILNIGTGATVGTSIGSTDFGTLLSHSLSNGEVAFDDAATYETALVINSSNLSDATGYLNANLGTDTTVTFEYDSTNDGSADSTFVFTNLASTASSADTLILLKSELGSGLTATAASTADNYIVIG